MQAPLAIVKALGEPVDFGAGDDDTRAGTVVVRTVAQERVDREQRGGEQREMDKRLT